jgi:hypothetical protein
VGATAVNLRAEVSDSHERDAEGISGHGPHGRWMLAQQLSITQEAVKRFKISIATLPCRARDQVAKVAR